MSRVGKKIITIPEKVKFNFDKATGSVTVSGPLGELFFKIHDQIILEISEKEVKVKVLDELDGKQRALWGTTQAILQNMVEGVNTGFNKEVELNGVGFKMELQASQKNLIVYIGFSHPINVNIPDGIQLDLQKNKLTGKSADKQLIGNFFTNLHDMKPCDPYKQKGFKFPDRHYLKKVGKKAGK